MSGAFLALWNDYPSAMTQEYEAWHSFEHVPERLTTPGMVSARRYAAFGDGMNRYFTLYQLEDLQTVEHPAYLDLVRNPTEWSRRMRRHFSNVLRIPAARCAGGGRGVGSCALVLAYSAGTGDARDAIPALERGLGAMVEDARILGFQIGLATPNQAYEVFTQDRAPDEDTLDVVIVVEGLHRWSLERMRDEVAALIHRCLRPRQPLREDLLDLIVAFRSNEFPADRRQIPNSSRLFGAEPARGTALDFAAKGAEERPPPRDEAARPAG
ncbi:hypothetical protein D3218_17345 [Aureimonas flava]|uniref:Uncharacterized protein n=1 Tax=Aureimonas flava TaxID=2320271 RepID=A0A3A1WIM4_9HYPH|nr:hypothetical protein [Aureimonas flava]RIX98497.1 hypothetical protein D3218_17345 [Aureimonas flava]